MLLSAGSAAGKKDHNNIGGTIMNKFTFFMHDDNGTGGVLDTLILYWCPLLEAFSFRLGALISSILRVIGV